MRGPGTLVPEDTRWIPATTEGRIERIRLQPGADVTADSVILELSGSEAFVLSCIRALERFEVIEVARSGTIALGTGNNLHTEIET